MCCLFGLIDLHRRFTGKEKAKIIHTLATAAEARGTDATGVAYNSRGKLHIYKRPVPAHKLRFRIPEDAQVVMGHTRMTTQGNEKRNYNNHPFQGSAGHTRFALAHNGVLFNDRALRRTQRLPNTNIETDSYIAVQLLEQQGAVSFDSLRYMAEHVDGSFAFTVLDGQNNLYFVKGDNPLCICYFPSYGLYLYASTEEILATALCHLPYRLGKGTRLTIDCGELLCIDSQGKQTRSQFDDSGFFRFHYRPYSLLLHEPQERVVPKASAEKEYIQDLKAVAACYGIAPRHVDALLADGFTPDEIEELLYENAGLC